jgi:uncharacterized membrane protein YdjX (TVP38/TMEM64 family)
MTPAADLPPLLDAAARSLPLVAPWLVEMASWHGEHPLAFAAGFFGLFTLLSALALPGCSVLALAAGGCFGLVGGTLIVGAASTAGALVPFVLARHGLRARAQRRFGRHLAPIEAGLDRDGARWLFTLRVVPLVPYPLLNPLMGLTRMPASTYAAASFAGLLVGSAVWVHAGRSLAGVAQPAELLSAPVAGAVAILAVFAALPWIGRGRRPRPGAAE